MCDAGTVALWLAEAEGVDESERPKVMDCDLDELCVALVDWVSDGVADCVDDIEGVPVTLGLGVAVNDRD